MDPASNARPGAGARLRAAAVRFVSAPASPLPLGVLRIGLGLLLLSQALLVAGHLGEIYDSRGLLQAPVNDQFVLPWTPRVHWATRAFAALGLQESAAIRAVFALHLAAATAFLVGWRARLAAVAVWLTHLTLVSSSLGYCYGLDTFMRIALFYCVFAPVGHALSLDVLAGRVSGAPSFAARLALRALQLQLALVYAATGLEKASGVQWWDGEALWRSWMRADLGTIDFSWVASMPWVAKIGCWATLLVEVGYAVFIWIPRTRRPWALATIALHAGIGLTLGLVGFACIMMLFTACAWLVPSAPPLPRALRSSALTVAYDGSCRVCRAAVGLALQAGRHAFRPVGRNHARRLPGLPGAGATQMVSVDAAGRARTGAEAFLSMWAHALGWPALQRLAGLRLVGATYGLFARHRHAVCRAGCATGAAADTWAHGRARTP